MASAAPVAAPAPATAASAPATSLANEAILAKAKRAVTAERTRLTKAGPPADAAARVNAVTASNNRRNAAKTALTAVANNDPGVTAAGLTTALNYVDANWPPTPAAPTPASAVPAPAVVAPAASASRVRTSRAPAPVATPAAAPATVAPPVVYRVTRVKAPAPPVTPVDVTPTPEESAIYNLLWDGIDAEASLLPTLAPVTPEDWADLAKYADQRRVSLIKQAKKAARTSGGKVSPAFLDWVIGEFNANWPRREPPPPTPAAAAGVIPPAVTP